MTNEKHLCRRCETGGHSEEDMASTVDFGFICLDCLEELEEAGRIRTYYG